MIGKICVAASAVVLLALTVLGGETAPREAVERVELREGEIFPVQPLKLTHSALFDVTPGRGRLLLRVTPDGFLQFVETGVRAKVSVRGRRGNTVELELRKGELVSVWPVAVIKLSLATRDKVAVDVVSPDWAFVVRAEEVRRGGLPAVVDGKAVTLAKGQRLDADMREGKVVFLLTAQSWPGRPVAMPAVAEHVREPEAPMIVLLAKPVLPGVLLGRGREYPWQTVPLPVIAWEVFRPPDVSR